MSDNFGANPLLARSNTERIARKLILRYVAACLGDLSRKNRFRDRLLDRVFRTQLKTGLQKNWSERESRTCDSFFLIAQIADEKSCPS